MLVVIVDRPVSDEEQQKIAREINFSETTFILSGKQDNGGYDVRIWTPNVGEVPFAGHPTLGTAYIIHKVLEKEAARKYGYEVVNVVPQPKAGGSFATAAYKAFEHPVAVQPHKSRFVPWLDLNKFHRAQPLCRLRKYYKAVSFLAVLSVDVQIAVKTLNQLLKDGLQF